ncbi:septal ring lytic transglycosylase RlpA family protein [Marinospirillum alkaliphilum]|uniref:Endolytic peptidoglycan transglycosylase RlpA n=1 Tax=Marinospirillum alkaliphilum DSM 21637 TaxID=1122209 RepID=A0A1K1YMA2_9GAMM|nr:septal ring lytic transglycosylase RlpA family protein [Marinospirillum alkaliphilum]SFX62928.1 rare lipoprotein A [Marinospirillum alkaliphilum DSM 21637]
MNVLRSLWPVGLLLLLPLLTGCSVGGGGGVFGAHGPGGGGGYTLQDKITSSGGGRYSQRIDSKPVNPPDVSRVPDAVPIPEPRSRRGNASSYVVFGQTYRVMESSRGFTQTGVASWYGSKFHGHETSNGEIYDMYAMTAAHTSLPLPTYVRVTNLENNRQVIVRVNDRGPFVGNRIIDLSYAAAYRLDMLQTGTARVRIEAIDPVQWQARHGGNNSTPVSAAPVANNNGNQPVFLQVAALGDAQAAQRLQQRVRDLTQAPVRVLPEHGVRTLYRVQVGPLEGASVQTAIQQLEASELGRPMLVRQ